MMLRFVDMIVRNGFMVYLRTVPNKFDCRLKVQLSETQCDRTSASTRFQRKFISFEWRNRETCFVLQLVIMNSFYKSRIHLGFGYSITLLSTRSLEKGCSTQTLSSSAHQELSLE